MFKLYKNRTFITINPKEKFIEIIRKYIPNIDPDHIHTKRIYSFDDQLVESKEDLIELLKKNYKQIILREIDFFVDHDIDMDKSFENFLSCFGFEIIELGFDCSETNIEFIDSEDL
ncbi:MAG: hypothetical protein CR982_02795 [Candidatus Cloacimonadota bacterium]|nr:MAG: hypothetical protein CR982_02795 [Candidatus Cloacimonadota bacterium]PIE79197.1 MAG: hypothetical protein CSA15_03990 [Candidatus Delongbacteria bacterium]